MQRTYQYLDLHKQLFYIAHITPQVFFYLGAEGGRSPSSPFPGSTPLRLTESVNFSRFSPALVPPGPCTQCYIIVIVVTNWSQALRHSGWPGKFLREYKSVRGSRRRWKLARWQSVLIKKVRKGHLLQWELALHLESRLHTNIPVSGRRKGWVVHPCSWLWVGVSS